MTTVQTSVVYLSVPITTENDVEKNLVTLVGSPEDILGETYNGFLAGDILDDSERAELIPHPTNRRIQISMDRVSGVVAGADAEYAH